MNIDKRPGFFLGDAEDDVGDSLGSLFDGQVGGRATKVRLHPLLKMISYGQKRSMRMTYTGRDGDKGEALTGKGQAVLHREHVEGRLGNLVRWHGKDAVCG